MIRELRGHSSTITALAISPKNGIVLAGALFDPKIFLWDFSSGNLLRVFTGHGEGTLSIAISPDGTRMLSSGYLEKAIHLWELSSGKRLKTFFSHTSDATCLTFSPDGRYGLSGASDGKIKIYDIERQREIGGRVHINEHDWAFFTGDGRLRVFAISILF